LVSVVDRRGPTTGDLGRMVRSVTGAVVDRAALGGAPMPVCPVSAPPDPAGRRATDPSATRPSGTATGGIAATAGGLLRLGRVRPSRALERLLGKSLQIASALPQPLSTPDRGIHAPLRAPAAPVSLMRVIVVLAWRPELGLDTGGVPASANGRFVLHGRWPG
jgi:hypothetical protein